MISLKKYMEAAGATVPVAPPIRCDRPAQGGVLGMALAAYRAALRAMGSCSLEVCPALGQSLAQSLAGIEEKLVADAGADSIQDSEAAVQEQLREWGRRTAAHYRQKTAEVKDLLLVMARTAESVGERDMRCAGQISEVTTRLQGIASLDDLTEIRASIEQSAADLRTSVDRMATEGKEAIAHLRAEMSTCQARLEEAEELASRDGLTGLHNRNWVEGQVELRMQAGGPLSLAILDIDRFKGVNDRYGHAAGDELLKQFAGELRSASRSTDVIGRWGGDEFVLVLDCAMVEAEAQIDRLRRWVCGSYTLSAGGGELKLPVLASIGLAERGPGETLKELLARADAAMYQSKTCSRTGALKPAKE